MHLRGILNFFLQGHGIVAFILLIATLAANFAALQSTSLFDKRTSFNASYQLSAPFLKWVSGGYWVAASDYLWIQSLEQIGTGKYSSETRKISYHYYKLAIQLDPDFYELYDHSGILFSFFHDSPDEAIEFLTLGIRRYESGVVPKEYWTHPYTLYIYLAYAYAFQKNDWTRAREVYLRAAEIPGAPAYLSTMKEWLKEKGAERQLAVRVLKLLIQATADKRIRQKYEEKLKQYER